MVIRDLNLIGMTVQPSVADPSLIVDTNAELTFAVVFQILQPITWWYAKILEGFRPIQNQELAGYPLSDLVRQLPWFISGKESFCISVNKCHCH
jgi:hypothetical protein